MVGFRDGWKVSEELSANFTISVKFLLLCFGSEGGSHSWSHQPKVHEFERPTVSSLLRGKDRQDEAGSRDRQSLLSHFGLGMEDAALKPWTLPCCAT